jgi:hypothetical protein
MSEKRWTVSCCDKHPWSRVRFRDGVLRCPTCEREGVAVVPHFHNVEVVPVSTLEEAEELARLAGIDRDGLLEHADDVDPRLAKAETQLQELREGLQREIEQLGDLVRMYVASPGGDETAEALAQASDRLLTLLRDVGQ